MNFITADTHLIECLAPALKATSFQNGKHFAVTHGAQPAHMVGIRVADCALLDCEGKYRPGTAAGGGRHSCTRDQDICRRNDQLDAIGAPVHARNVVFPRKRFAAIIEQRPLAQPR